VAAAVIAGLRASGLAAKDAVTGTRDPAELLTSTWTSSPGRSRS
jgi:hypothetical protein